MSKVQGVLSPTNMQLQGSKSSIVGQSHILLNASMAKGILALEEFKYGFPSEGLSTATYKWWGSGSSDGFGGNADEAETNEEDKSSEEKADCNATSTIVGNEKSGNGKTECKIDPQGSGLLTVLRKRTAEEGREALKLGVYKKYCVKKPERKERLLLLRIFRSSLPKERIFESS